MEVRWDAQKAALNYSKHGISFADAATALDDPMALTLEDRRHAEQRFVTLGLDARGRLLVVVYGYPASADVVRLISA
ncbi:MAG: BrnT family toxin [Candidatus Cybelea sp.]